MRRMTLNEDSTSYGLSISFIIQKIRLVNIPEKILFMKNQLLVCNNFPEALKCRNEGSRMRDLSSACKTDRADFTEWMPFLPFNRMAEISPNEEALSANT